MNNNQSNFHRALSELKSIFVSGLFTLLPLALTIALFGFAFRIIHAWSRPLYMILPCGLKNIPHSEIVVILIVILLIGAILKYLLLHPLVDFIERKLFGNIPIVRQVYFGIKQLLEVVNPKEGTEDQFQRVVLVEFPRPGMYCIGLVTSLASPIMIPGVTDQVTRTYYNIFVPTTPNPTTGFFFIIAEDECKATTLTRHEAMALVISGGILQPDRFTNPHA